MFIELIPFIEMKNYLVVVVKNWPHYAIELCDSYFICFVIHMNGLWYRPAIMHANRMMINLNWHMQEELKSLIYIFFYSRFHCTGKEWLSCRDVLWYVAFCGFGIDYILRLNFSLAIVAMVLPKPELIALAECTENSNASNVWVNTSSLTTAKEENVTEISVTLMDSKNVGFWRGKDNQNEIILSPFHSYLSRIYTCSVHSLY